MANFVLFETTESIIEILWDIALAFFIVRLAFIYFALAFTSGAAITYVAYNYPQLTPTTHKLVTPQSEVVLAPFLLLSSVFWAYVVVTRCEIPRVAGFRLATGGVALLFMVMAEAAVGLGLWEEGYGNWMGERVGLGFCALLAAFALMPTVLMAFEAKSGKKREDKTWHGHEEKRIIDAVPTVNVSDKEKRQ
ncbi:hypothetical protein CONLIGDRAFT_676216 [Coniochaeta ligniaria NRRL 30616]|uniref:Uncharacterized protein n=1 Tax=Coniochaeta ligniaria NRRL 30616 TaxID=1408157 RepID=A0A1J7K0Q8_9PEZI|nr:hypothetical protein CONLIGDRAFT_676216 [Coniochaeta ligniaria NRRL 30616]